MPPRSHKLLKLPTTLLRTLNYSPKVLFSTSQSHAEKPPPIPASINAKWLSEIKARIGKCIMFGMSSAQIKSASGALGILGREWRELVAGREGFLTSPVHAGLRGHQVVWGEMDSMGHVNNVMYIRYAESARVQWALNYALHHDPSNAQKWKDLYSPRGVGMILKSIKVDYKFPMTFPDRISVFHKLRRLPDNEDSAFGLDVVILSEGKQRVAARCEEEVVVYDYREGRKCTVEGWMLNAFKETWERQESEKKKIEEKVAEVERVVKELEKGTWDQEDAVEDMGAPV